VVARRRTYLFNLFAFAIGAVALAIVLDRLGWDTALDAIVKVGTWFAVMAAIDLASVCCDAFAIHGFLGGDVSYPRVFAAQASGIAINRLTPANTLGEPVKITMLMRSISTDRAVAAIVMFNLTTMYIGVAAILVGVPLTAVLLDLPHAAAVVAWVGLAVLLTLATIVTLLVRRGALGSLIGALARVRAISQARAERWRGATATIDAQLRELGNTHKRSVRRGIAGVFGSRLCNWVGTIVVIHAAGIAMTAPLVVAMLSVGILVTWMSNVIPLGLGIRDGTNYALYGVLGASPDAGLVFTMVDRVRTVVLAMMGLTVMAVANLIDPSGADRDRP
jgi:uncharacterized protein (TIRG00374 family)